MAQKSKKETLNSVVIVLFVAAAFLLIGLDVLYNLKDAREMGKPVVREKPAPADTAGYDLGRFGDSRIVRRP